MIQNAIIACEIRTRYSARNRQRRAAATRSGSSRPPSDDGECHPGDHAADGAQDAFPPRLSTSPRLLVPAKTTKAAIDRPVPARRGRRAPRATIDSATATPACRAWRVLRRQRPRRRRRRRLRRRRGRSASGRRRRDRRDGRPPSGYRPPPTAPRRTDGPATARAFASRLHGERHPLRALPIPIGLLGQRHHGTARLVQQRRHHRVRCPGRRRRGERAQAVQEVVAVTAVRPTDRPASRRVEMASRSAASSTSSTPLPGARPGPRAPVGSPSAGQRVSSRSATEQGGPR